MKWHQTYLSTSFAARFFLAPPDFLTPLPDFFAAERRRGVDELDPRPSATLKWAAVPLDLAMARILNKRSEIARGVGASWSFAVRDLTC